MFWENFGKLFGNDAKAILSTNNLILSEQSLFCSLRFRVCGRCYLPDFSIWCVLVLFGSDVSYPDLSNQLRIFT